MPLEWHDRGPASVTPGATAELRLWPHRSLDDRGFAIFIGATFLLLLVPLSAVIGTVLLWVLLPFLMGALAMIWTALRASSRQGRLTETLTLTRERILLIRRDPRGAEKRWEADPHWVSVHLHPKGGPVENYLTLRGGGREVELGAFLSADERKALHDDIDAALRRLALP